MKTLIAPIVSEKATSQAQINNIYHFKVQPGVNKIQVKQEVEQKFEVKVKDVRIMNVKGKRKTQYTKAGILRGKKADWRKAIVRLSDGYKLDLYTTAE